MTGDTHSQRAVLTAPRMQAGQRVCSSKLLASIQGGAIPNERKRHAAAVAKHNNIFGVVLGGLGTGESAAQRDELISISLSELPQALPRFLSAGVGESLLELGTLPGALSNEWNNRSTRQYHFTDVGMSFMKLTDAKIE